MATEVGLCVVVAMPWFRVCHHSQIFLNGSRTSREREKRASKIRVLEGGGSKPQSPEACGSFRRTHALEACRRRPRSAQSSCPKEVVLFRDFEPPPAAVRSPLPVDFAERTSHPRRPVVVFAARRGRQSVMAGLLLGLIPTRALVPPPRWKTCRASLIIGLRFRARDCSLKFEPLPGGASASCVVCGRGASLSPCAVLPRACWYSMV